MGTLLTMLLLLVGGLLYCFWPVLLFAWGLRAVFRWAARP